MAEWGVVIALILGSFYFLVIQKFVNDMSKKVKYLEDDHIDAISVYEDLEDVMEIFSLMDAIDKKRVKNYMKFVKKTHPSEEYKKMLREFEKEEQKIDGEYYGSLEKIFNNRVKNRIKKNMTEIHEQTKQKHKQSFCFVCLSDLIVDK